jgi:hypothetical protein
MPGVHRSIHGPESAGDDAALIQRKASFDTRRADQNVGARRDGPGTLRPPETKSRRQHLRQASVAQRQSATFTPWKSEGQHLPDALGVQAAHNMVDGAGWRGGWS